MSLPPNLPRAVQGMTRLGAHAVEHRFIPQLLHRAFKIVNTVNTPAMRSGECNQLSLHCRLSCTGHYPRPYAPASLFTGTLALA